MLTPAEFTTLMAHYMSSIAQSLIAIGWSTLVIALVKAINLGRDLYGEWSFRNKE